MFTCQPVILLIPSTYNVYVRGLLQGHNVGLVVRFFLKRQSPDHTSSYGESHCRSVGCIIDGCPPGMALTEADIQPQMTRRRPGQSALTTPRNEKDAVEIQSGTEFGITLGTPIGLIVRNEDQRPKDYGGSTMDMFPRPSHADFTYLEKYGVKASSGGGRSSARETIGKLSALQGSSRQTHKRPPRCRPLASKVGQILLEPRSPSTVHD